MKLQTVSVCLLVVFAGCIVQQPPSTDIEPTETPSASEKIDEQASTPTQPRTASARYDVDTQKLERAIHEKMNARREEHDLDSLQYSQDLASIARFKSWDLAQKDYFTHSGANGTSYSSFRGKYNSKCEYYAQNLHKSIPNEKYINISEYLSDTEKISSTVVNSLMNSTGHRKNILDPNYQVEGIGVFVDENGTVFVTQEFCGYD